jgi:hypothetical protein
MSKYSFIFNVKKKKLKKKILEILAHIFRIILC